MAIGATAGLAAGRVRFDLNNARIGDDFIDDVTKLLLPNKVAVVAEIEEDWITPVDTRMEAIGGIVFRRALADVKHTIHEENVAAMKADLAQMKAEQAKAPRRPESKSFKKRSTSSIPRYKRNWRKPRNDARQRNARRRPRSRCSRKKLRLRRPRRRNARHFSTVPAPVKKKGEVERPPFLKTTTYARGRTAASSEAGFRSGPFCDCQKFERVEAHHGRNYRCSKPAQV